MPGEKATEEQRRRAILAAAYRVAAGERLTGFSVQQVAQEAGVSKGLVFFYYGSKDALLVELLGWMLESTIVAQVDPADLALPSARQRLLAVLRRDIEGLPGQRQRVELFFDYWVLGTRHPEIRRMIRAALDRYREAYRVLAAEVVDAEPERYASVGPDGLAAVATSFVTGCALQAVMDPERFDVGAYMETLGALVAHPRLAGR